MAVISIFNTAGPPFLTRTIYVLGGPLMTTQMVLVGPFMSSYLVRVGPLILCRHIWSGRTTYVPGPNMLSADH